MFDDKNPKKRPGFFVSTFTVDVILNLAKVQSNKPAKENCIVLR